MYFGRRDDNRGRAAKYMVALLCLLFALNLVSAGPIQSRSGIVEGQVLDAEGKPVGEAIVYVLETGRTPVSITDENGNFRLTSVNPGQRRIFAYKESDGYPNPVWSFYGAADSQPGFPLVVVQNNGASKGVIIRLGAKASRLRLRVTDAITKRAISNATVSLNHLGKPTTMLTAGATTSNGELTVLIPAKVLVELKVSADGYQTYHFRNKRTSKVSGFQLQTGENRFLNLEMTRN